MTDQPARQSDTYMDFEITILLMFSFNKEGSKFESSQQNTFCAEDIYNICSN